MVNECFCYLKNNINQSLKICFFDGGLCKFQFHYVFLFLLNGSQLSMVYICTFRSQLACKVSRGSKQLMGSKEAFRRIIFCVLLLLCVSCKCLTSEVNTTQLAVLKVDASPQHARKIPETLFGIFFEVL